jgi:DNA-binding NarL/FixJ family response regulator
MTTRRTVVITGRKPKLSPSDLVRLLELREHGFTDRQLAREFNISPSTVMDYLHGAHKNPALVAVRA